MDAQRTTELLDQAPPSNPGAERGLLGAIILKRSCLSEAATKLEPSDFSVPANASLYGFLLTAGNNGNGNGDGGDVIVLRSNLEKAGLLEQCGGFDFIAATIQGVPDAELPFPEKAGLYVGIIKEASVARASINAHLESVQELYAGQRTAAEIENDYRAEAEMIIGQGNGQARFPGMTCAEVVGTKFEVRYLVDQVLVAGQPCILAGPKKSLKTSLLIDLAISLATGGHFLGKWPVPQPCRVGLMSGESGMSTIQETICRIAQAANVDPAGITNLIIEDHLPIFGNREDEAALETFIDDHGLEVLAIDPAYMAIVEADHGNLFSMGAKLRGVSELCSARGVSLVLAHHAKKRGRETDPFGPPELEDIAWSGFQEWARQWVLLARREDYIPGTGQHRLWLAVGGSAGHGFLKAVDVEEGHPSDDGGRRWGVDIRDPDQEQQDREARRESSKAAELGKQLEADRTKVVRIMVTYSAGQTKTNIRNQCEARGERFNRAFASLLSDGTAKPVWLAAKGNGRSYEGYRLTEGQDDE